MLPFSLLPAAAAEADDDDVNVAEDDHGGRKDRPVVKGHDQLIPLELPDLVGDGLHFKEGVAARDAPTEVKRLCCSPASGVAKTWHGLGTLPCQDRVSILMAGTSPNQEGVIRAALTPLPLGPLWATIKHE